MSRVAIVAGTSTQRPQRTLPSTWNPLSVKSQTNVSWFNADTGSVSSWTDQGPNVRHLLQATGNKQPTIAANQVNGKQVYQFASAQFMQTAAFTAIATDIEVMMVAKFTDAPGSFNWLLDGSANTTLTLRRNTGGDPTVIYGGAGSMPTFPTNLGTQAFHLYHFLAGRAANAVNSFLKQDNLLNVTGYSAQPNTSITKFTVAIAADGVSLPANCQIRNIFISAGALNSADRADLINYFSADAGLGLAA